MASPWPGASFAAGEELKGSPPDPDEDALSSLRSTIRNIPSMGVSSTVKMELRLVEGESSRMSDIFLVVTIMYNLHTSKVLLVLVH